MLFCMAGHQIRHLLSGSSLKSGLFLNSDWSCASIVRAGQIIVFCLMIALYYVTIPVSGELGKTNPTRQPNYFLTRGIMQNPTRKPNYFWIKSIKQFSNLTSKSADFLSNPLTILPKSHSSPWLSGEILQVPWNLPWQVDIHSILSELTCIFSFDWASLRLLFAHLPWTTTLWRFGRLSILSTVLTSTYESSKHAGDWRITS